VSRLTRGPLDVARLVASVSGAGLGGTAVFLGSVRRSADDGPVAAIDYSAYEDMAESELERIITEGLSRWPTAHITVEHRLGRIPVGEASIAVVAASAHRAEAFDACRWVIEEIKRRLPIWKKEIFEDGTTGWGGNDGTRDPATVA
jgi:molybdopterin synthase catalytic subunit